MKVLIIDDDRSIRMFHGLLVENIPAVGQVLYAKDGKEGLKIYREEKPDLVLTDFYMPEMDGQTMAELIRVEDIKTPIFLISGTPEQVTNRDIFTGIFDKMDFTNVFDNEFFQQIKQGL